MADMDPNHFQQFIKFRNPDFLLAIIAQMFMVVAAMLVIMGILYVITVVILITIHNFCYDRDPKKIPDFVKRSMQFSSDEDESEFEYEVDSSDLFIKRELSEDTITEKTEWMRAQPTTQKKTQLLEKFLNEFSDRNRNANKKPSR